MALLCGIDIGTSATKVLLCTDIGKVLATASVEYPVYSPKPGWSEQEPEDWWRASVQGIAAACTKAKIKPSQITGIGLSGQMHGSVFVDKAGKSLRRALLWNDQRTAAECTEIEQRAGGRKKLIGMVSNVALTGFTAPKILWVRKHDPKTYERTYKILLPKDYIRLKLTGEYASEVSDAAGTLLLDIKKRVWHKGLLGKLDIDADLLAPLYESPDVTGLVTDAVAKLTGLKAGTPVVGGAGDQPAGAVGNGIVRSGIVSATMGTSGVVFAHADVIRQEHNQRVVLAARTTDGREHLADALVHAVDLSGVNRHAQVKFVFVCLGHIFPCRRTLAARGHRPSLIDDAHVDHSLMALLTKRIPAALVLAAILGDILRPSVQWPMRRGIRQVQEERRIRLSRGMLIDESHGCIAESVGHVELGIGRAKRLIVACHRALAVEPEVVARTADKPEVVVEATIRRPVWPFLADVPLAGHVRSVADGSQHLGNGYALVI